MRDLTSGEAVVQVPGETIRWMIKSLDERYPCIRDCLCNEEGLRPNITVIVNGEVGHRRLRQALSDDSEVHFLPAISGGD